MRTRLLGGVSGTALVAVSAVTFGVTLPREAAAQSTIPSGTTTVQLNNNANYPNGNPFTVNSGTTISTATGDAIYGDNTRSWTLTNHGTVSASAYYSGGINLKSASTVTNTGTISSTAFGGAGIFLPAGGTITNNAGGAITGYSYGISGGVVTITNAGTIKSTSPNTTFGGFFGILITGGSVTNDAGGTISTAAKYGAGIAITGSGTVTNNGGVIAGGSAGVGVYIQSGGSLTNTAGGSITGGYAGFLARYAATVINAGTITAANGTGVHLNSGGSVINQAGGVISGGVNGIYLGRFGAGATVTNAGTITGGMASVLFNGTGANVLILQTGSVLNGAAVGSTAGGATNALVLQGTGGANNNFVNFNTLDVQAAGVWALNGTEAIGTTTLTSGTLQIGDAAHPGAQFTGNINLGNANTTLSGHGTILGTVSNNFGIVAPGGTIGTLTVSSFTQAAGGKLFIEVSPAAASLLHVTGAATLGGTIQFVYDPGTYTAKTYQVLTASSISGSFANIAGTAPVGVTQSVTQSATEVDLMLSGSGTATSTPIVIAPTNATHATGLATASLESTNTATGTLFDHLLQSRRSGDTQGRLADVRPTQLAFAGAGSGLGEVVAALPEALKAYGGWVRATGNFSSLNTVGATPGFDTQSGGFLAGLERHVSEHLTLGLAAGYAHTNDQDKGGAARGSIDTPRAQLYGSYALGPYFLDGILGYAHDSFSDQRQTAAGIASSSHDGNEFTVATQVSRRARLGGFGLTPQLGFQYTHLAEDGFHETGANGQDLSGAAHGSDSARPFVAAILDRPYRTDGGTLIVPEVHAGYSYELASTARQVNTTTAVGSAFLINGISPSRSQPTLGAGITVAAPPALDLFLRYDYAPRSGNETSTTISAGLRYRF